MTDQPGSTAPTYELRDGVAVITLDDGKANAIDFALLDAVHDNLDRAADEARAVVIAGRPGKFSAGFNLALMTEGVDTMRELVTAGARMLIRLYGFELPTVTASDGHALAAGALLLLAADVRIGAADTPSKIGLNEVAIGMQLPVFAVELARARMPNPATLERATAQAQLYDPEGAVAAGYLDRVVPSASLLDEAMAEATRLGELRTGAYRVTKQNLRRQAIDYMEATLAPDMASLTGPAT
ncbi:MAG TPA: crotonase/enoyl-CoA hydratase family protein [Acidimicrobiales bacterium]|jgi:enoyl-CoA hydratase|nr:crotonase/enoyl-CoA hydratase family protein [Acidimicrobiales bacterium]